MHGQIIPEFKIDGHLSRSVSIGGNVDSKTAVSGSLSKDSSMSGGISSKSKIGALLNESEKMTGNIMETILKGLSAYEVAVKNGFEGSEIEWLNSLVGDSVKIDVVKDEKSEYILSFTVGEVVTITPNLKPILVKGIDYLTESEVEELINDVTVVVKSDIDDTYQRKGEYIEGTILTVMELEDLLQ